MSPGGGISPLGQIGRTLRPLPPLHDAMDGCANFQLVKLVFDHRLDEFHEVVARVKQVTTGLKYWFKTARTTES